MAPHWHEGRVNYSDSDALAIMHHARYFEHAERARIESLADHGIDIGSLRHRVMFAIHGLQTRFHKPLFLDQAFGIASFVRELRPASMRYTQLFLAMGCNNPSGIPPSCAADYSVPCTRLDIDIVFVTPEMRLCRLPADLRESLEQIASESRQSWSALSLD